MNNKDISELFGLPISNVSLQQASTNLVKAAVKGKRRCVFFVNAHCVNVAAKNEVYRAALDAADVLYADGIGMRLAAKFIGQLLVDNVNGTDLFPVLCRDAAAAEVSIALLGAKPGIAELCAERMTNCTPGLRIVWIHHGYLEEDVPDLISSINKSGASMLLVAMGVPQQELWITRYASELNASVLVGVGALFDFYSGSVSRAPFFMRKFGMEWLFRFFLEPKRMFLRYIVGNPIFIFRALVEKYESRNKVD
ncbi:WecB/TagA/CpsF family glycosyltransferase [Porticoccus sp.]